MKALFPEIFPAQLSRLLLAGIAAGVLAVRPANAANDFWNGGVPSGNWSSGANWLAGVAPTPGDLLIFTNQSGATDTASDDFANGTMFDGITFASSSVGSTFTLNGSSILLSGNTNGITIGITNSTSLTETVNNNLNLDWGYHTFYSPAAGSSLNLNGTLTLNSGGVADFQTNNNVTSTSYTVDGTGLITGLGGAGLMGNNELGGGFSGLATVVNGIVTNYTYAPSQMFAASATIGSTSPTTLSNIELTAITAVSYTLAGGSSATYGTGPTYVSTIVVSNNTTAHVAIGNANGGTLVLGTNDGNGIYIGGIYLPNASTGQGITIGDGAGNGTTTYITSGPMTGNPVPGIIILGINGNNVSNEGEINSVFKDNLSGGQVTVVYAGSGSQYINVGGDTYSGGTYVIKGRVQCNANTDFGTGPAYVAGGDAELSVQNVSSGVFANNLYLSPASSYVGSAAEGSLRLSGTQGISESGTITLQGNPVTPPASPAGNPAVADRISIGSAVSNILSGQITGPGTLEFYAAANPGTFILSNVTVNANNWTGGLIVDGAANDGSNVRLRANNQLGNNNVTLIQAGTGFARLDLNGFSDTIGFLNGSSSILNEVGNFGAAPSTLTMGVGNATGSFSGVIGGDTAPNTLSIVKIGSGKQTLGGANTYLGSTLIEGGTLALVGSGSVGSTPQITVSNATFDVSAASSFTSTASIGMTNAVLNMGSVVATAVDNLSISNTAVNCLLNQTTPNITVTGTFNTGGTTNLIEFASIPGFGSYPQQIHVIKYGTQGNNLVDVNNNLLTLGVSLPTLGGLSGYLTNNTVSGSIDLVLTAGPPLVEPITWNGQVSGINNSTWDILTTSNWVITGTSTPYPYQDTSPLTFDDTAAGTTTVNLTTTVFPGSINFTNDTKAYVLTGSGKISGSTGLTNGGVGTLTLTETGGDNFSGGLTVNSGKVVIDNNSSGITGGTVIDPGGTVELGNNDGNGAFPSGTMTNNGALVFNRNDTAFNLATVIAGTGSVTNSGSGTVELSAVETYTGSTVVNAGFLELNGPNASPSTLSSSSGLMINNGGTLVVLGNNSLAGSGTALGTLPITVNAGGTLTGAAAANGGAGTTTHIRGLLTLNGGTLANGGAGSGLTGFGSWSLDDGLATAGGTSTSHITALCIVPSEAGGTVFNIPNGGAPNGVDLLVTGSFTNAASEHDTGIIKTGNGTMVLDNSNAYTNGTTISTGTLQLGLSSDTSPITSPMGTGGVTNNATLNFASSQIVTVTNVITGTGYLLVSSGEAMLDSLSPETYTGNTVVTGSSTLALGASSSIVNSGEIIIAGGATFNVSGLASGFALGSGQTLSNNTSTAAITGSLNASAGDLGLTYAIGTPSLSVTNGQLTLATGMALNINNTGLALPVGTYTIITNLTGGSVIGTVPSSFTVSGGGIAAGTTASLNTTGGSLNLVVSSGAKAAVFTGISVSGSTLTINATNGADGGQFTLVETTNLLLPINQWTPVFTNSFDGNGDLVNFSTNVVVPNNPQEYYLLLMP